MKIIISAAKTLKFSDSISSITNPDLLFVKESKQLQKKLRTFNIKSFASLTKVSTNIAKINIERIKKFGEDDNIKGSAIESFQGSVYQNLDYFSLDTSLHTFIEKSFRIISGMYGLLRPFDIIEPYRLDMGTSLKINKYTNLYQFWNDKIAKNLLSQMENDKDDVLINLASHEYFKAIESLRNKINIIDIEFLQTKDSKFVSTPLYSKIARGKMSKFIIENKIENPKQLIGFDIDNYSYNAQLSNDKKFVFTR